MLTKAMMKVVIMIMIPDYDEGGDDVQSLMVVNDEALCSHFFPGFMVVVGVGVFVCRCPQSRW